MIYHEGDIKLYFKFHGNTTQNILLKKKKRRQRATLATHWSYFCVQIQLQYPLSPPSSLYLSPFFACLFWKQDVRAVCAPQQKQ